MLPRSSLLPGNFHISIYSSWIRKEYWVDKGSIKTGSENSSFLTRLLWHSDVKSLFLPSCKHRSSKPNGNLRNHCLSVYTYHLTFCEVYYCLAIYLHFLSKKLSSAVQTLTYNHRLSESQIESEIKHIQRIWSYTMCLVKKKQSDQLNSSKVHWNINHNGNYEKVPLSVCCHLSIFNEFLKKKRAKSNKCLIYHCVSTENFSHLTDEETDLYQPLTFPCNRNGNTCQRTPRIKGTLSCCGQVDDRSLNEWGEWRQVHGCGRRWAPSSPTLPPKVSLRSRWGLLEDRQSNVDKKQPIPEVLPWSDRPSSNIIIS